MEKPAEPSGLSRYRRRILMAILFAAAVVVIAGLKLHATISEDLVLHLTPTAYETTLVHGERHETRFTLRTNNYLFCEAVCDAILTDLRTGRPVWRNEGLLLKDSNMSLDFPLEAPQKGEGLLFYGLSVTCANSQRRFCARSSEEHLAAALITVTYGLTDDEMDARDAALSVAPAFFASVAESQGYATAMMPLLTERLDGREERARIIVEATRRIEEEAELILDSWREEEYLALDIPIQAAEVVAGEARAAYESLREYTAQQEALVAELRWRLNDEELGLAASFLSARDDPAALDARGYARIVARIAVETADEPYANATTRLVAVKSADSLRDAAMTRAKELVEEERTLVEKLLVREEERIANATNMTSEEKKRGDVAETVPGLRDILGLLAEGCAALNATAERIIGLGLEPLRETNGTLAWCAITFLPEELFPPDLRTLRLPILAVPKPEEREPYAITIPERQCCLFGACAPCGSDRAGEPILFLHGHSMNRRNAPEYSLQAFAATKRLLEEEILLVNGGVMTPYDAFSSLLSWRLLPGRVGVSGTYYYDSYLHGGSYILSAAKSESLDTYAIRVKEIVDALLRRTGEERVVIVAHSMGGLVARRYLQLFGEEQVSRLVMIGTPNHGITSSVATFCPLFGADKECEEMRNGSSMLAKLNDPRTRPRIPVTVILGTGCDTGGEEGDGVVTAESARLDWAETIVVEGTCSGVDTLHTEMLKPALYPAVYADVKLLILEG